MSDADPTRLTSNPLIHDIMRAPNLLIVEEGQGFASLGSELVSQLAEHDALEGLTVRRLHPPAHCIPSCGPLEKEVLLSVASIVQAVLAMDIS